MGNAVLVGKFLRKRERGKCRHRSEEEVTLDTRNIKFWAGFKSLTCRVAVTCGYGSETWSCLKGVEFLETGGVEEKHNKL
jgi:hypothetical protein